MRARYYDPLLGRFISEDPARDGGNWYAYAVGNPVGNVDPDGRAKLGEISCAGTAGAAMTAAMNGVAQTMRTVVQSGATVINGFLSKTQTSIDLSRPEGRAMWSFLKALAEEGRCPSPELWRGALGQLDKVTPNGSWVKAWVAHEGQTLYYLIGDANEFFVHTTPYVGNL